ncbi:hypothetical protein BH23BAC1_BH23BAC1_14470 [soil metagenome]
MNTKAKLPAEKPGLNRRTPDKNKTLKKSTEKIALPKDSILHAKTLDKPVKEPGSTQVRKKVLMLGWEFPPVINGGLGVARLGISKGLSKFVDLTVILPKSDPGFIVQNVELIGVE